MRSFLCVCAALCNAVVCVDRLGIGIADGYKRAHATRTQRIAGDGFQTPIDEIDAAARILDPVMVGLNHDELHYGVFFKDYRLTEW